MKKEKREIPKPKWLTIPPEDWSLPFTVDDNENEIVPAAIYEVLRFFGELYKVGDFDPESRWTNLTKRKKFIFSFRFDWSLGQIRCREPISKLSVMEGFELSGLFGEKEPDTIKASPRKTRQFKSVALTGIKGPPQPWPISEWITFTGDPRNFEREISIKLNLSGKSNAELQKDFGIVLDRIREIFQTPDGLERSRLIASCKNVLVSLSRLRILPSLQLEYPKEASQEAAISEFSIDGKEFPLGKDLRSWKDSEAFIRKFRKNIPIP